MLGFLASVGTGKKKTKQLWGYDHEDDKGSGSLLYNINKKVDSLQHI